MDFTLHNTASGKKEIFKPLNPNRIGMYLCGPTVYDYIHIGNARPLVVFDVLYRYLKFRYREVVYVRNITDIDDKINARAKKLGVEISELTKYTTRQFKRDARYLNCEKPTYEPLATNHIKRIKKIISRLIERRHAYEAEGHVLFDTRTMPDYGNFARISEEQLIAGSRVEKSPFKQNPQDFVLWKPSDDETPGWDSPWGFGRPGWHIECSAMSHAYLGESFDLHLGGQDLIFPHHQNEIAQSCCAFPDGHFARYWMHNGYLLSEGEKMSKSLGNFYTVRELLSDFPGEALRLSLLQTHYRKPLDFSIKKLAESKKILDNFYDIIYEGEEEMMRRSSDYSFYHKLSNAKPILKALSNDFNIPLALTHLYEFASEFKKTRDIGFYLSFRQGADILGIGQKTPRQWFLGNSRNHLKGLENESIYDGILKERLLSQQINKLPAPREIQQEINLRNKAKRAGDYETADAIREELKQKGIELRDTPNGTDWRKL